MTNLKPIEAWKRVFLDTSVIIDYLQGRNNQDKEYSNQLLGERINLTNKVFELMREQEISREEKMQFFISSISVAELLKLASNDARRELILLFNTSYIKFVDFTQDDAIKIKKVLNSRFENGEDFAFLKNLRNVVAQTNAHNPRSCVVDDLKIVASASNVKKLDIVLTSDWNSFQPIADIFSLPCLSMKKENFQSDLFGKIYI